MLEVDDDFKAVVLEVRDGLRGHEEIFFGGGFEGALDIEQARFDDDDGGLDVGFVIEDDLHVGPIFNADATATGAAEEGELGFAGVDGRECAGELQSKGICSGEADLGVVNAEVPMRSRRPTALGMEISRLGCWRPSRRLVSKSSTCGLTAGREDEDDAVNEGAPDEDVDRFYDISGEWLILWMQDCDNLLSGRLLKFLLS